MLIFQRLFIRGKLDGGFFQPLGAFFLYWHRAQFLQWNIHSPLCIALKSINTHTCHIYSKQEMTPLQGMTGLKAESVSSL